MSDAVDEANEFAARYTQRLVDKARAAAAQPDPVPGDCEACCDEDVPVKMAGGLMRCTPCRSKWEQRR